KKVNTLSPGNLLTEPLALSADGTFIAAKAHAEFKPGVDVYSVADGKRTRIIADNTPGASVLQAIDFLGDDKLLITRTVKLDLVLQVFDIKTGNEVRQITAPAHTDRKQLALSPGRRYAAVVHKSGDRVLVYDLNTGMQAGEAPIPKETFAPQCQGLAF